MKKLLIMTMAMATLIAFSGIGMAGKINTTKSNTYRIESNDRSTPMTDGEEQVEIPEELQIGGTDSIFDDLSPNNPVQCNSRQIPYLANKKDNFQFNKIADATIKSPNLNRWLTALSTYGFPTRIFDQLGTHMVFGHSFKINSCKICAVKVEFVTKACGGGGSNSSMFYILGDKPLYGIDPVIFSSTLERGTPPGTTHTVVGWLPQESIDRLNEYIFTTHGTAATFGNGDSGEYCPSKHWLNIVSYSNHAFDYIKLTIQYSTSPITH